MKVITIENIVNVIRARQGYKNFLSKFIEECEIVDAIPIPEGATNGDMIEIMFPDKSTFNGGEGVYFNKDWWYAPYKRGVEE